MFYHLEGRIAELMQGAAVVDCNGVGYLVNTSLNTQSRLKTGERAKLYISESVREDAFELFGFATRSEKRSFDLLIAVSGVGPKAALSILSAHTPEALTMAILAGDEKALTVAPGIGKKIAQRVILELKDKLASESVDFELPVKAGVPASAAGDGKLADAAAALGVLGYGPAEINLALKGVDTAALTTEEIIKAALKNMMKK
ncbi:MAG TPA: Holliday junction branch migration protein RuvA [Candidatus Scatomorpha pullistercoris]|uniref:Holliday junction branch migration complex subunit RuvA n=1 Tax=Candidatus Scatomorpha pullistercoris TaxID=2840929 RepID=A0A9D1G585_9FIRM|nr:Holliday junction branch migration protein RuvA [Candidatus Scatomorpha pullistercoris]